MKKVISAIFLLLLSNSLHSQTVTEINAALGFPDSLSNTNEIRIYKRYAISNGTDIFRMFRGKDNDYVIEFYNYYHSIQGQVDKPYFEKKEFTTKNNELIWMKVCTSNIQYLPDWKEFQYKFVTPKVVFEDGQYLYLVTQMAITDGVGYYVYFKKGNKKNHIIYSNPESYLEKFPETDELEMFVGLLNTLKLELGVWN